MLAQQAGVDVSAANRLQRAQRQDQLLDTGVDPQRVLPHVVRVHADHRRKIGRRDVDHPGGGRDRSGQDPPGTVGRHGNPARPHTEHDALCPDRKEETTYAVPRVGWPAKGSSYSGVKIRTSASTPSPPPPVTNVVSQRLLPSDGLHLLDADVGGVLEDGQRVAGERVVTNGEDVDDPVGEVHGPNLPERHPYSGDVTNVPTQPPEPQGHLVSCATARRSGRNPDSTPE